MGDVIDNARGIAPSSLPVLKADGVHPEAGENLLGLDRYQGRTGVSKRHVGSYYVRLHDNGEGPKEVGQGGGWAKVNMQRSDS